MMAARLLLATLACAFADAVRTAGAASGGFPVVGHLELPAAHFSGHTHTTLANARLMLHLNSGEELVAFPKRDGSFVFYDVPAGVHILDVDALGYVFPQLRIDVSAMRGGIVTASYAENTHMVLPDPLVIAPITVARYFEERQPFNLMAFVKSPMGMMMGFMLFAIVVMPRLKLDPDEYRQLMEARNGGGTQDAQRQLPAGGGGGGGGGGGQRRRRD